ncbi:AMP-binding protein [Herbidospora sp. NEAU-GS84]|uniref:AMP-binding protein n=1 Tax=Herbidospora solisilvae TaxID=2696284 RepID=A0A7C9N5G8_9ACTN|nr:fatty acid--CoA ligase family protein [Herbidospora solisilvae]NAS26830.1 AMP-binding protein [Herbidospora solisilvae]
MVFPAPLLDLLREEPRRPVFEHGPRVVTRAELLAMIGSMAGALDAKGLRGRAVAFRTSVTPEAFAAQMAAHVLGCRVVGVRPGYSKAQLEHVLAMDVDHVVDDATLPEAGAGSHLTPLGRPGDVAMLAFTSGSTGRPKGCALTYDALDRHWAWQPGVWSPVAREMAAGFERYLLFGTLASMVVFEFLGLALLGGGTVVIPVDPEFPRVYRDLRITGSIFTVPRLTQIIDTGTELPDMRAMMVGGSPISASRLEQAVKLLGPVVYQGYGATEAGSISMLTPRDLPAKADTVGRPHPMVQVRAHEGELLVSSPYLMRDYWNGEENPISDGWYRTGDLGHVDDDGYIHIVGRAREAVMVNAMVVYLGPIERALESHPSVEEAYVVGAPDRATGEAAHAFVVAGDPDIGELKDHVREELGADHVPATITVIDEVPLAASGKPDKKALLSLIVL